MSERICLMTFCPTDCKDDCFNCECGGAEATKDMYVSINNVQRVCSITSGAADTNEGEYLSEVIRNNLERMIDADVQSVVDTENMATVSDEFICKKCGIYLKDYIKVVMDEVNDGYIDEQHYKYEPKFCPECGAKVESRIKTPKRDRPLYTMDEICKMNGVEFKDGDTE